MYHSFHNTHSSKTRITRKATRRGGATVLKVGENFFDPPLFGQWGGAKYCLDS